MSNEKQEPRQFNYFTNHGDEDNHNSVTICYGDPEDPDNIIVGCEDTDEDAKEACKRLNKILKDEVKIWESRCLQLIKLCPKDILTAYNFVGGFEESVAPQEPKQHWGDKYKLRMLSEESEPKQPREGQFELHQRNGQKCLVYKGDTICIFTKEGNSLSVEILDCLNRKGSEPNVMELAPLPSIIPKDQEDAFRLWMENGDITGDQAREMAKKK